MPESESSSESIQCGHPVGTGLPRLIVLGGTGDGDADELRAQLSEQFEVVIPKSLSEGLRLLRAGDVRCLITAESVANCPGLLLQQHLLLEQLPEGIALLDESFHVLWHNKRFDQFAEKAEHSEADDFYGFLGLEKPPEPCDCVLTEALSEKRSAVQTIRVSEGRHYELQAIRLQGECGQDDAPLLLATVRDVSVRENNRQKFDAIYQAGLDLGDLSPVDVTELSSEERIELLKSKILHYTQDVMQYDTIEIRLFNRETGDLNLLLEVGMQPLAASRKLMASTEDNGVTGFVAATGKSYLCRDTLEDPLYLPGAEGARSSLTVPLIFNEEILGTFNVESPEPNAFDEEDLQFLELFSREIASALNTLDLLAAEQRLTAAEGTQLILKEVATPVDEILNDSAWILEKYIGHDQGLCDRLNRILKDARQIRQMIQRAGDTLADTGSANVEAASRPARPRLRGKRILVVDEDPTIRQMAHELLDRFDCVIETAHNGDEACLMARSFDYDAVIADIRLPDMNGYQCYCELKQIHEELPVILMTGYGYDPTHSIVKARQSGLTGVLYKPFRLDQLIEETEKAVTESSS